eukprot:TRINITY_DN7620_c0_g1_i3.p1 TRINITY_DN7620_c0_g1~~TRINITY_DN7620_c0_g1_i3.p1  ORF type:complete len:187 (-),score=37.78 TRINITY_DN7620_c0_g1_i3:47-607(-)
MKDNLSDKLLVDNLLDRNLSSSQQFEVEDFEDDDNHVVFINKDILEKISTNESKFGVIEGKRKSYFILIGDPSVESNKIRMNKVARKNVRAELGNHVSVNQVSDLKVASSVTILPFQDTIKNQTNENIFQQYLSPHFEGTELPIAQGDILAFSMVTEITDSPGLVSSQTKIIYQGNPVNRNDDEKI